MYNFGNFDAFIVKPTIMPDFARNLLHYNRLIIPYVRPNLDVQILGY